MAVSGALKCYPSNPMPMLLHSAAVPFHHR
jgi:hypothetical protein